MTINRLRFIFIVAVMAVALAVSYMLEISPVGPLLAATFASTGLLAVTIVELLATIPRAATFMHFRKLQGRYFEYRSHAIGVHEDEEGHRWIVASDTRRVLPGFPRDELLRRIAVVREFGNGQLAVRSDSMLATLGGAAEREAQRFQRWVLREIHHPSPAVRSARPLPARFESIGGDD